MAACVFCEIVRGERAADVVLRSEDQIGFLDHRPLFPGHVLLVPCKHTETLPDLPPERLAGFLRDTQRLCHAVETATGAQGTFVAVNNRVSQSVPHLHVHVVPRTKGDGLKGFFWPRTPYDGDAERERMADAIRRALEGSRE